MKIFFSVFLFRKLKIKTLVFPGGTDSRFIRQVSISTTVSIIVVLQNLINNIFSFFSYQVNIPAIGFSPIARTPVLLHDHNEFLQADVYLHGIEVYKKLVPKLANA